MRTIMRWVAVVAIGAIATSAVADDKVRVVASFSILADLVQQVGGERVEVASFVAPNTDMHTFQPSPSDSKQLADAQLVVINGLGLEGWIDRMVKASGYRGARVIASQGIKPLPGEHGHSDPHAWQDVANAKVYVGNIRDALVAVDSAHRDDYERRAADYLTQLDAVEAEIKAAYLNIPKPRRVITSHDAFGYYGHAYGIEFLAPQGVSGDAEPSAKSVAQLIRQIKREKVAAVFVENISSARLMDQIARESGAVVGGTVYSDALSDAAGPAATYLDMMRHNTRLISAALRGERL
jgi:zinc/manganese transport system substrate-binding protein